MLSDEEPAVGAAGAGGWLDGEWSGSEPDIHNRAPIPVDRMDDDKKSLLRPVADWSDSDSESA